MYQNFLTFWAVQNALFTAVYGTFDILSPLHFPKNACFTYIKLSHPNDTRNISNAKGNKKRTYMNLLETFCTTSRYTSYNARNKHQQFYLSTAQ